MNELALFAGAGGGILGGHLLGWRTVCAVELDDYAAGVLVARQNDGTLPPFPIWNDVRTFDGRPWCGVVDVVSGGFPCQDISLAGKGAGINGTHSGLWGEMARIVGEVRPRFVFVENSSALVGRGIDRVIGDLSAMGYDARWGVVGAWNAGAPHVRERAWIVARDTRAEGIGQREQADKADAFTACGEARNESGDMGKHPHAYRNRRGRRSHESQCIPERGNPANVGEVGEVADTDSRRCARPGAGEVEQQRRAEAIGAGDAPDADRAGREEQRRTLAGRTEPSAAECRSWWEVEPSLGRVVDGMAYRVDQLRALGNGQVPAVARLAWELLTEATSA